MKTHITREDIELKFQLEDWQIPTAVIYKTINNDLEEIIVELPFIIKDRMAIAILPAYTEIIDEPNCIGNWV